MKEDDGLIQLLLSRASTLGARRAFAELQDLLAEHCAEPAGSRLSALCPGVGRVFRELDLVRAFDEYDGAFFISARRFVPLSFLESRQVFNLASVAAAAEDLKLVTLDADDTIYSDGGSLDPSSPMIPLITRLLVRGVHVALVTAASYPGQPERFEARLAGLLSALSCAIECGAPPEPLLTRFRVMTGQCNVLLVPDLAVVGSTPKVTLREVAGEEWKAHRGVRWAPDDIKKLLDTAQHTFEEVSRSLQLQVSIVRKERAVGLIAASGSPLAAGRLTHDVLEELTLAVQEELGKSGTTVPFCAFNGGYDAFVDIGNKALGVAALQGMVNAKSSETLHIGDQCECPQQYPRPPTRPPLTTKLLGKPVDIFPRLICSYANRERPRLSLDRANAVGSLPRRNRVSTFSSHPASPTDRCGAGQQPRPCSAPSPAPIGRHPRRRPSGHGDAGSNDGLGQGHRCDAARSQPGPVPAAAARPGRGRAHASGAATRKCRPSRSRCCRPLVFVFYRQRQRCEALAPAVTPRSRRGPSCVRFGRKWP